MSDAIGGHVYQHTHTKYQIHPNSTSEGKNKLHFIKGSMPCLVRWLLITSMPSSPDEIIIGHPLQPTISTDEHT